MTNCPNGVEITRSLIAGAPDVFKYGSKLYSIRPELKTSFTEVIHKSDRNDFSIQDFCDPRPQRDLGLHVNGGTTRAVLKLLTREGVLKRHKRGYLRGDGMRPNYKPARFGIASQTEAVNKYAGNNPAKDGMRAWCYEHVVTAPKTSILMLAGNEPEHDANIAHLAGFGIRQMHFCDIDPAYEPGLIRMRKLGAHTTLGDIREVLKQSNKCGAVLLDTCAKYNETLAEMIYLSLHKLNAGGVLCLNVVAMREWCGYVSDTPLRLGRDRGCTNVAEARNKGWLRIIDGISRQAGVPVEFLGKYEYRGANKTNMLCTAWRKL
jgi:hypothetical protein